MDNVLLLMRKNVDLLLHDRDWEQLTWCEAEELQALSLLQCQMKSSLLVIWAITV